MSRVRLQAACDATGLTPRGVQAMAARGEIPGAAKIGRVWTFDADKLARWIRAREQATWQRAQDATSIGGGKHTGRASKLPGVTCGKAYAQAIGLQILAPRFDSGRGLQPNPLNIKTKPANVSLCALRMKRTKSGLRPAQTPAQTPHA